MRQLSRENAVGLAVMSLNLLLFATAYGFGGAIDSYASQAFGAKDVKELSAILLRQLILLCGLALVAAALLLNAEALFLIIGVRSSLATRSAQLLHLMSWAVPGDFAYDCMARWMRGQQLHRLVSACSIAALGISLVVNITLMDPDAPTRGPLLALIAQNTVLPLLLGAAYCYGSRPSLVAALADLPSAEDLIGQRLWSQLRTAIAAMVWTCAELWAWEVQVFEAAHLGTGNAAAYTLLSTTYSLLISAFPVSAASAVSALMGEALGQGDPRQALTLLRTGCALTLLLVLGYTTFMFFGRFWVASVLCGGVADVAAACLRCPWSSRCTSWTACSTCSSSGSCCAASRRSARSCRLSCTTALAFRLASTSPSGAGGACSGSGRAWGWLSFSRRRGRRTGRSRHCRAGWRGGGLSGG